MRGIQSRTYTVTEVYAADREDALTRLTGERAILGRPLWDTVKAWVGTDPAPTRIQVGMRHATASMTRRYTKQRDKGENAKAIAEVMCASA